MDRGTTPKRYNRSIEFENRLIRKQALHRPMNSFNTLTSFSKAATPKSCFANFSFYEEVETVLQEIDPNFRLFVIEDSPVSQILLCLKRAVSMIKEQKSMTQLTLDESFDESIVKTICEHCRSPSNLLANCEKKIREKKEKLEKNLKKFEKSRFIQTEKIKEEKRVLAAVKDNLVSLTNRLAEQKQDFSQGKNPNLIVEKLLENSIEIRPLRVFPKNPELSIEKFTVFQLENSLDFTSFIEELDSQIALYNHEISLKENSLIEREALVLTQEAEIKKQLSEIELMSLSLESSKSEMQEIKYEVFPALEFQSELVKALIDELHMKRDEIEAYFYAINKEIEKDQELEKKIKETEEKYKENCEYADYLVNLHRDLDMYHEEKNKELKENGEQLCKLQKRVDYTIELITHKENELLKLSETLWEREKKLDFASISEEPMQARHQRQKKSMIIRGEQFFYLLNSF